MKVNHPRLKRIIKRMNRGLALGLAIVIVMTVWLSVSAARVRRQTPELRAMTREYLTELIEISALMNGDEIGKGIPSATRTAMKNALGGIVDKYYTDSKAAQRAYNSGNSKKSGMKLIDEFLNWSKGSSVIHLHSAEIKEEEIVLESGRIHRNYSFEPEQKAGKYLEVWFTFEMKVVYDTDSPADFSVYPFSVKGDYPEYYGEKYGDYVDKDGDGSEDIKGQSVRVDTTLNVSGRITFVFEDGSWRIACTQGFNAYVSGQPKYETISKEVG